MTQANLDLSGRRSCADAPLAERPIASAAPAASSMSDASEEKQPQRSLFELDESWRAIWKGMPEFVQRDLTPLKTIYVHFETRQDMVAFAILVDQPITMHTRSIWYPEAEHVSRLDKRYIDASPDDPVPDGIEITELDE